MAYPTDSPDSPWTSRLKATKAESLESAILAAKEEEIVSHLTAILPSSLNEYSSPALTSLVALHGELGLHPTDVETASVLTRLDTLSQTSTELEIDVLVARQAINVLTKEQTQMEAIKKDIEKLQQTLDETRPPPGNSAHDDSVLQTKVEGYIKEKARLEARFERDGLSDISALMERAKELEELERQNETLRNETAKYKGLPADYDLAKLQVEEERRALRERQVLREETMAAAFT